MRLGSTTATYRLGSQPVAAYRGATQVAARTLYFNNAAGLSWATLGNWWQNPSHTVPATAIPGEGDDVVISASNLSFGGPRTVRNLTVMQGGQLTIASNVTVTGTATFNGNARIETSTTLNGTALFNGTSQNRGTINGSVTFSGSSGNRGTINGNAVFNGTASNRVFPNVGTVNGNATFNENATNGGTVTGTLTFNSLVLQASPVLRQVTGGTTETITTGGVVIQRTSSGERVTDFSVTLLGFDAAGASPTITSSNTAVLSNPSPQSGGLSTFAAAGVVTFTATDASGRVATALATATNTNPFTDAFVSFATGSVAQLAADAIDSRLAGKTAAASLALFATQSHTATPPAYVRNASFWGSDIDFTCCSVWNSSGSNTRAGTLISPRHVLFAAHYQILDGATVRFVDASGTVVNRVMTSKVAHPNYTPYFPDIAIGVLDSDVPAEISFARVLPVTFASRLAAVSSVARLPVVVLDQEEKGLIADWTGLDTSVRGSPPTNAKRLEFFENIIPGDSGNPVFMLVNGQPVLLTVLTFGGPGFAGTAIASQRDAINSMMASLGGGYQLTDVNLSNFAEI